MNVAGHAVPSDGLLSRFANITGFHSWVGMCEVSRAPRPPSGRYAVAGATVIAETHRQDDSSLMKSEYSESFVKQQSARYNAAYLHAGTVRTDPHPLDLVFRGHSLVYENGFSSWRKRNGQPRDSSWRSRTSPSSYVNGGLESSSWVAGRWVCGVLDDLRSPRATGDYHLERSMSRTPRPRDEANHDRDRREIFSIRVPLDLPTGCAAPGPGTSSSRCSGGLDLERFALLVARKAFDILKPSLEGIPRGHPCRLWAARARWEMPNAWWKNFETTQGGHPHPRGRSGALQGIGRRCSGLDTTSRTRRHASGPRSSSAWRTRTEASLSARATSPRLAMGCTRSTAVTISMYNVNGGVPKPSSDTSSMGGQDQYHGETSTVLRDVCATTISPSCCSGERTGSFPQKPESLIGPTNCTISSSTR